MQPNFITLSPKAILEKMFRDPLFVLVGSTMQLGRTVVPGWDTGVRRKPAGRFYATKPIILPLQRVFAERVLHPGI